MKIYKKIILDKNDKIIKEEHFEYFGPLALAGIHFDYKSTKSAKLMEKQAKREKKLAERKKKRMEKAGIKSDGLKEKPSEDQPLSLEAITNPDKE